MKRCNGCGIELLSTPSEWGYCARCEHERNDESTMPLVWEYVGSRLGSLPNARSADYFLERNSFETKEYQSINGFSLEIFTRPDDGSPMGVVAIRTVENALVIVSGKKALFALFSHTPFAKRPSLMNLPPVLIGMSDKNYYRVMKAKAKQN